jgi:hypothetical protein
LLIWAARLCPFEVVRTHAYGSALARAAEVADTFRHVARAACAGGAVALLALGSAGCTLIDVSRIQTLTLEESLSQPDTPSVIAGFEQNYLGRISMDVAFLNTSATTSAYVMRAQAQTSGTPEDSACENFRVLDHRSLQAVSPDPGDPDIAASSPVLIRDVGSPFVVVMPAGSPETGFLELRTRATSLYRIHVNERTVAAQVFTTSGVEILPLSVQTDGFACEELGLSQVFSLSDDAYRLRIQAVASDTPVMIRVDEDCATDRRVARTCPGQASETIAVDSPELAPGERWATRLSANELGVGDQAVVELACATGYPTCTGALELVFVTEDLECRTTSDCNGQATCSDDGYCIVDPSSGCAAARSPATPGVLAPAIALLAGCFARRSRRRPKTSRRMPGRAKLAALLSLAAVCGGMPAESAAQSRNAQVDFGAGAHVMAFTGTLGRYTSPGPGVHVTQGVHFGWLGFELSLGSESYLSDQPAPPLLRGLQAFTVTAGPRFSVRLNALRVMFAVDYANSSYASNALVRYTGNRRNQSGVGTGIAIRYDVSAPLFVQIQPLGRIWLTTDDPLFQWGVSLTIGMSGGR